MNCWTTMAMDARLDIIREAAEMGKSGSQIAQMFVGATRSAVLGLCMRKGIKLGRNDTKVWMEDGPRVVKPGFRLPIRPNDPPLPGTAPVHLLDLPNSRYGVCRWPVGEEPRYFCGVTCPGDTYCTTHSKKAGPRI